MPRAMRSLAIVVLFSFLVAGCSGASSPDEEAEQEGGGFDDLDLDATDTTCVIRGVVVDDRIVPVEGANVAVRLDTGTQTAVTDAEGRFGFDEIEPGTYFLTASKLNYEGVQSTVECLAGVDEPAVQRILLVRLFDVEPYSEVIKFEGFLACSNGYAVGTTCVNDYTRLVGCLHPSACPCPGGCLRDYNVSRLGGNNREYVHNMTGGWQTMVWEMVWDPTTSTTSAAMAVLVSFHARPTASHFYGSASGQSPVKLRLEVNETGPGQQLEPSTIPPEGIRDLFTFVNASNSIAINQDFTIFHFTFYHGKPPEDWSFVDGDEPPF
jgi:hypothetical protein